MNWKETVFTRKNSKKKKSIFWKDRTLQNFYKALTILNCDIHVSFPIPTNNRLTNNRVLTATISFDWFSLGCGIINRKPESVEKPHGISCNRNVVFISVPAIVSMCSVLYFENGMPKTCFPISRVLRLWNCHAAVQRKYTHQPSN